MSASKVKLDKFNFFLIKNVKVNSQILETIQTGVDLILKNFKEVVSIMLVGALSRGEGVWKIYDGRKILSDLDFFVITKRRESFPKNLKKIISKKLSIKVDIKYSKSNSLKNLPKDTHVFDYKEGLVLYGENLRNNFPRIQRGDLDFSDISSLFFNRIFLSIENLHPSSFNLNNLEELSHNACKTLFTCTDILAIENGFYSPKVIRRARATIRLLKNNRFKYIQNFIKNLRVALRFRFFDVTKHYIKNSIDFWFKSRDYLLYFFAKAMEKKFKEKNILFYDKVANQRLSISDRILCSYKILKIRKVPKFFWRTNPTNLCRMALLFLYLAIDKKGLRNDYTEKANEYLSKIYFKNQKYSGRELKWNKLKDDLIRLHQAGIF